jgi:hypothetical protein
MLTYINFSFDFLGLDKVYFKNYTSPMNSYKMSKILNELI